jgi:hypothetical protein
MEVLQRTANRGSISTGYDIDNSLKFEPDNSEYLHKTPTSSGNRRTFTISMWIKRTEIGMDCYLMTAGDGDYNQSDRTLIKFDATDNFRFGGGSAYQRTTNRVFRDTSAWYHIVMAVDTTDSTAANRLKLYVNGVQETSFSTSSDPSQNFEYAFCKDDKHSIGFNHTDNVSYYAGYMSEVILIDGQQLAPTEFGEFDADSGIWKPIDVSGLTFGTNGFYLDFADSANLGNDASGGLDFTLNNITSADQATDTPTNNFCTWSTLWNYATSPTMTEGATKVVEGTGSWGGAKSSIGVANGKWYWELKVSSGSALTGIQTDGDGNIASGNAQAVQQTMALYYAGTVVEAYDSGGNRDDTNVTFTYNANDTYGIALDMDSSTQTISFYQNGSLITNGGNINIDGLGGNTVFPFAANNGSTTTVNFGGYTTNTISSAASDANGYGTFEYAPPSGYYAICTKNLAEFG